MKRTTQRFGITSSRTPKLLSWSVIRTRACKPPKQIKGGLFDSKDEIAIFIALGDWKESNGIFAVQNWSRGNEERLLGPGRSEKETLSYIELRSGEDVSVEGTDTLFFSGNAGGLALMLQLQLPPMENV